MTAPRDALLQALDRVDAPVHFFVRDDDAGWDDSRLLALLDTVAACGTPIDLAVIPAALHDPLARQLLQRRHQQPLGLHQHGWAHANHQGDGRKGEFGTARSAAQREADIAQGALRLRQALGGAVDGIFTPPWNRCADDVPALLQRLGFDALSRSDGAPAQAALPELPVHCDWCRHWREAAAAHDDPAERIAADLARTVRAGACIGLMLHHAVMDDDALAVLASLLARWQAHPHARWHRMADLLPVPGA